MLVTALSLLLMAYADTATTQSDAVSMEVTHKTVLVEELEWLKEKLVSLTPQELTGQCIITSQ